ncbi:universal stress protein [Amycolatopsis benzoatilytica]|uniref:universal stress protein n=1 Tax=Amycolatopsis benzoatilytica TaxID=346045 RepID=UPI00036FB71B|nr:universal stress protein [Amycolatopsis benzoatilytica]
MTGKEPSGTVLVGIDESEAALSAVRWAAAEAVRRDVPLQLYQAGIGDAVDAFGEVPETQRRLLSERGHRWLRRAVEVAEEAAPGVRTWPVFRVGFAADLLIAVSRSVSLIVLGSHGLGGVRGAVIGSVALRVAASAHCPVVVVRGRATAGAPVAVGVDGDDRVLEFAFEAAESRKVPLVVVHAWHEGLVERPERAGEEERVLRQRIAGWAEKFPTVPTRGSAMRERSAARALMAAEAQLVVIGSRGRGPVAAGLLGSTGNRLLAHSACPVAVVH